MNESFNPELYGYFARIGKAFSNGNRIALLNLLGEGEQSVDVLSNQTGLTVANTSQHLQHLRHAGLVESRKNGQHVYYRLSDTNSIMTIINQIQSLALSNLPELNLLFNELVRKCGDQEHEQDNASDQPRYATA